MLIKVICLILYFGHTLCQDDPLCAGVTCRKPSQCRIIAVCPTQEICTLKGECIEVRDRPGECPTESKIFVQSQANFWVPFGCPSTNRCPESSYCARQQSVCCRSNPVVVLKPGKCSPLKHEPSSNLCIHDGDCPRNLKCCDDTSYGRACRFPFS